MRSLVAGLNHRVVAGSYSPTDGQANPVLTTRAFATAAKRYGATYWNGAATKALLAQGERVQGVQTERRKASDQPGWAKPGANERRCLAGQEVRAEHVVLAAGAWSDEIAATVGLRLPIRTRALQMLLSTPAPSKMLQPVLSAVSRTLSLKQLNDGAFLIGSGWLGDPTPDRRSYTMRQSSVEGNWATACELLPAVGQQQIARTWCGLEAQSFDDIPFIGPIPGLDGLTLAVGFSGHGFAIAPAIGRAVADQISGRPTPELDGLSPGRITTFPSDEVEAFITGISSPSLRMKV